MIDGKGLARPYQMIARIARLGQPENPFPARDKPARNIPFQPDPFIPAQVMLFV
jgi:hypothetical protein